LAAVQVARALGAQVYATAGSPEKRAYLRELGIRQVYDSRSLEYAAQIREETGDGVDVVLNALTGEHIRAGMGLLRPGGRFVEIGKAEVLTANQAAEMNPAARYLTFALDEMILADRGSVGRLLREMVAAFAEGQYRPLPVKVFEQPATRQAFRYMAQSRHMGKIVVRQQAGNRSTERGISPEKSYLITGGLGGLGLVVADWLVEQGVRYLALLGRGPGDEGAQEHVELLRSRGARVEVYQADVADFERLAAVMTKIGSELPALGGVIHAAGVLDDGVLAKQDWSRFERVLAPKVAGAWNLHRLSEGMAPEYFVLFSSSASVLGSSGQGSYTAGNSFLDGLAHYRRAMGLPAVSINWGPWDEVGMAAGLDSRQRQRMDAVMHPLSPGTATKALERILQTTAAQAAVMDADWAQIAGRSPFFEGLLDESAADQPALPERGQLLAELLPLPAQKRRERLLSFLRGQAVRILGLDAAFPLDPGQPLNELGLDSLMAVEMRNALGALLDRSLPATVLFDYPTLAALTDYLAGELPAAEVADKQSGSAQEAESGNGALSEQEMRQLEEIRQLSDEEAAAAIARELQELADWEAG
jgi:NAD(P)-dependent dehydrogenase (short-subunit alcohol dehydrogenase family)/acyl carrier protein